MARKKQKKLSIKWIVIFGVMLVVFIGLGLLRNNATNKSISKEDSVIKVKALPEVREYLKRFPNGLVLVNEEENNSYMVQVYELKY